MVARPLFREKHVFPDGSVIEMVLWQLPKKTADRPHRIKYRLYYGSAEGRCLVRYDNETGKGDHRHDQEREFPYTFVDVETLMSDFLADVARIRRSPS
jgi:hypothetical protein